MSERIEFAFPDKFLPLLEERLKELRKQGVSKSAFFTQAALKALGIEDAPLLKKGWNRKALEDNGAEQDGEDQVPKRKPHRPGPDPEPDDDEEAQDEVEPALPDLKPLEPISASPSPPENRAREGRCSRCSASGKVFDSPGDKREPLCGDCLDQYFWGPA